MARYPFLIADVFTDRPFSGNQLGVVLEADGLATAQMQAIAAELHFAETTFVLRPRSEAEDVQVRIFTPMSELPFAGHPTVGTALALAWRGLLPQGCPAVTLGEGAGPVAVDLRYEGGRAAWAEFRAPAIAAPGRAVEPSLCAAALGLEPGDLEPDPVMPCEVPGGVAFVMVPLRSRAALARAQVKDLSFFDKVAPDCLYLLTRDTGEPETDLRVRMFAPMQGIPEDPATGSAAASLAALLGARAPDGVHRWRILQGAEMGRPSRIEASARVEAGKVTEVRVAGAAVLVAEGTIEAPPA
jgi:trans-2,3-dihydro-3-hydroxyanthranilate isomerase